LQHGRGKILPVTFNGKIVDRRFVTFLDLRGLYIYKIPLNAGIIPSGHNNLFLPGYIKFPGIIVNCLWCPFGDYHPIRNILSYLIRPKILYGKMVQHIVSKNNASDQTYNYNGPLYTKAKNGFDIFLALKQYQNQY